MKLANIPHYYDPTAGDTWRSEDAKLICSEKNSINMCVMVEMNCETIKPHFRKQGVRVINADL